MLTARQNLLETIKGGNPDRLVNQYEPFSLQSSPFALHNPNPTKGGPEVVNAWGVTRAYPSNVPGAFPVHTPDKIVIQDIEHWRDYVKFPELNFTDEEWDMFKKKYDAVDRDKAFATAMFAPGLFEQSHYLSEITNALIYYMEYEDEMHDLINAIADWELELVKQICDKLHPDAVLHHDDWGSETNSFLRPEMFRDYFLEPYQRIYGYMHDHGVQVIVHHSDSYCANLVPTMIEMGIDIWQGAMYSNNIPELLKQYGPQMTIMGGIDNKFCDFEGSVPEDAYKATDKLISECGTKFYIPCITQGGPGSIYPGVYGDIGDEIRKYNHEHYGFTPEEQLAAAVEEVIMFGGKRK